MSECSGRLIVFSDGPPKDMVQPAELYREMQSLYLGSPLQPAAEVQIRGNGWV